jgi:hypothetical protein
MPENQDSWWVVIMGNKHRKDSITAYARSRWPDRPECGLLSKAVESSVLP